jgi:hypothetical protein
MKQERRPVVTFRGDADGWMFRHSGVLEVPSMLNLLTESKGIYRDLMLSVRSEYFLTHRDQRWEMTFIMGEETLLRVQFWKQYSSHQCIIPLGSFHQEMIEVRIVAAPLDDTTSDNGDGPVFVLTPVLVDKREVWNSLEQRSIWLFSTARSGSTWVGTDILCWNHRARPIDESGIGRMFAPISWEAERFFEIPDRPHHYESGFDYEIGVTARSSPGMPPFERVFRNMEQELKFLNRINFDLFHRMLRDCALEHVLNEWGVKHDRRLVFKMPNDSHAADFIMRAFPRSFMVFLMRDGRDVLRSRFSEFASGVLAKSTNDALRRYAVAYYSHFWNFQVDIMRTAYEAHNPALRYFARYEDLRSDPLAQIGQLLEHVDMKLPPEELERLVREVTLENMPAETRGPDKPRQEGRISGYLKAFSAEEIELMNGIMGDNLKRYGYTLE